MKLIALPWKNNLRYHYVQKLYCCWISNPSQSRWYYNWNTADSSTFSATNYMAELSIYWGGRTQHTTSEEEAKKLVDNELVKCGWTLLEPGNKLLVLLK
jgi:hypothetical protein